jgi:hypothetical protein
MESLGKIFGSNHRVKIMRLFLFNETTAFDIDDIVNRSRVKKTEARKEINMLVKIGFLKKKSFSKKVPKKTKNKKEEVTYTKVKKQGWIINNNFKLVRPLRNLLLDSELIQEKGIIKQIRKSGTIKLLVLSGIFIKDANRKLDILIVGKKIKRDILEKEVSIIESEIGRELRYAFFSEKEFSYRLSMYDKLVRDIIENEHRELVNTLK